MVAPHAQHGERHALVESLLSGIALGNELGASSVVLRSRVTLDYKECQRVYG
jgi:hypothetical protein